MSSDSGTHVEITHVEIGSLAKVMAITQALWALLVAFVFGAAVDILTDGAVGTLPGAMWSVCVYGIGGFVGGLFYGFLYNISVGFGALQLEMVAVQEEIAVKQEVAEPAPAVPAAEVRRRQAPVATYALMAGVLVGIVYLASMFPMEMVYKKAKEHFAEAEEISWGPEARTHYQQCLAAATHHPVISLLYPIKRARMGEWARQSRLKLAVSFSQEGYVLAAAVAANRYLALGSSAEGKNQAQAILDQAAAAGISENLIAAAEKTRCRAVEVNCTMTGAGRHTRDWRIDATCQLRNGNSFAVGPVVYEWEVGKHHRGGDWEVASLSPGESTSLDFSYSMTVPASLYVSRSDITLFPVFVAVPQQ